MMRCAIWYLPAANDAFIVGREASVRALEERWPRQEDFPVYTAHASVDDPKPEEIYAVAAREYRAERQAPGGNIKVLVEGVERARAIHRQ